MEKKDYNGWTNYETWCVKLWLDNEQSTSEYWSEQAQEQFENAEIRAEKYFSQSEKARFTLADQLKQQITDEQPEMGASMYSDLLGAALSEVNWNEIANAFLEEVENYEYQK